MADEYIVEMRHITKRFPGIVANDDISLGIKKGEIFGFFGSKQEIAFLISVFIFCCSSNDKFTKFLSFSIVFHDSFLVQKYIRKRRDKTGQFSPF